MNLLPEYYSLLRRAQQASEDVDNFDLTSFSVESRAQFLKLKVQSREAQVALLTYVELYHARLVAQLREE